MNEKRIVPVIPACGEVINLIIDSDIANEIDDLYALAIVFNYPERFNLEGIVATHFSGNGPANSTEMSFDLLKELLKEAGKENQYTIKKGSHPMQYAGTYNDSEGVDFIIETARRYTPENPLWVVGIGAATNLACAILKAPDIIANVRYIFHSRSEATWPERSIQFNVYGDIIAAQTLLESQVPLIWFDTGTFICASYETTEKRLASIGTFGKWLHDYRNKKPWYCQADKGFFDMGDFSFMYDPSLGKCEVVDAPIMNRFMYFEHTHQNGQMLRVYDIDAEKTWELFYNGLNKKA